MKIKIETLFGTLVAEPASDPNYPEIWISLIKNVEGEESEAPLVLVETHDMKDGTGYIRCLAYTDLDDDEYTDERFFLHKGGHR